MRDTDLKNLAKIDEFRDSLADQYWGYKRDGTAYNKIPEPRDFQVEKLIARYEEEQFTKREIELIDDSVDTVRKIEESIIELIEKRNEMCIFIMRIVSKFHLNHLHDNDEREKNG